MTIDTRIPTTIMPRRSMHVGYSPTRQKGWGGAGGEGYSLQPLPMVEGRLATADLISITAMILQHI